MLDDAFEHLLCTFVGGEEFDAEDPTFFPVHVTFGDAVHGFHGVFEARAVGVLFEVFFETFERVVIFAEGFEEGAEFESSGFGLGAERGELDDGPVGVGGFADLSVGDVVPSGFQRGIGVEFPFPENVNEPTFAFFVRDVCCAGHGWQCGDEREGDGGELGSEDVRGHGGDVVGGA